MRRFYKKIKFLRPARLFRSSFLILIWLGVTGAIVALSSLIYFIYTLPDPASIVVRQVKESTKIFDRTGNVLLYDIYNEEKRTVVPWENISDTLKKAVLASEDSSFYQHKGLDINGVIRAVFKNLKDFQLSQGGSTITQQLVGNALVGREKTFQRKIKELLLSIKVERYYSKDQIFWMYLNQIPFGSNTYGIQAASQTYFNKDAKDLTWLESSYLAGIIKAPSYYSPYGPNKANLDARASFVLKRIHELGYMSDADYKLSSQQQVVFQPKISKLGAPHFVIMVKEYLTQKYGKEAIESGGFRIITTLDAGMQDKAEELVKKYAKINKDKYKASNASLVAIDPRTGEVLSLVGSANYFDTEEDGNFNVATALRQPGSAFKPFAYAALFSQGYPDYTVVFDAKTEFNPNCSSDASQEKDRYGLDCYHPNNYDGWFRGPVTLRQSLSQSLNIPSVKTLYLAGIDKVISLAEKMGITTLKDKSRFGLSLVLGGAEVKLVDITSAYGVFANDGIRNPWFLIKNIQNNSGENIESHTPSPQRALDQQTARMIADILSDNQSRAPVFGYNSSLYFSGRDVAAKTGTTQKNRDAWVLGFTPSLAVGVWTGNNDETSMTSAGAGISAAGPLWHDFMANHFPSDTDEQFLEPNPVIVDKIMLNGSYWYHPDGSGASEKHSILHYISKDNPLGPIPLDPSLDVQYKNWEEAVLKQF